jgi:hypothetical protein
MPRVTHMQNSNTTTFDSRDVESTHSRTHHGRPHTPTRTHSVRGRQQRDEDARAARHAMSSTTAAPQTPAHRPRYCATTAADSHSDRAMQRSATHSDTATQRHSDTATQHDHSTHCRSRKSKSNIHTDTRRHSAAAAHTATLHTQRARHQGSNTRREHGSAHPPTTASSSV